MSRRPRVLVVSRSFPSVAFPTMGMWVARLAAVAGTFAECRVLAPVPWTPPFVPGRMASRFRTVPAVENADGAVVLHPRTLIPPGHALHAFEARLQFPWIRRAADRLHRSWPFDLIHAHFIFPDGVMAARLGRRYGVPVITTEHALWQPWLETHKSVRSQILAVARDIARVTAVSTAVERSIRATTGETFGISLLPNVVDDSIFTAPDGTDSRDRDQLLFVGAVRYVKGLDVLIRALASLLPERPKLHLLVLGEAFFDQYRKDEREVRRLCEDLGVSPRVTFGGRATAEEVARAMRSCAMLVVPSRRESFSAVAVEALASGTPVVATRCGGPEDFLSTETGALAEPDDPADLAAAIRQVLLRAKPFDPAELRRVAVGRFGVEATRRRLEDLYRDVLGSSGARI